MLFASGVHFNDMSIAGAKYLPPASGSTSSINEVVVCGRKPYFYSYDIGSGEIIKNTGRNYIWRLIQSMIVMLIIFYRYRTSTQRIEKS